MIDDVHMDEDAKFILNGLDTLDQKKDFYYVYFRMRSIRGGGGGKTYEEAYANDNLELGKEGEFIENIHNEFVGERRVDVDDEIQDEPMEVEKSIGEEKKIHKNDKKAAVLRRKKIHRNKKGGVPCEGHCDRTFKSTWNMKRHLDAENIIECEYCRFGLRGERNYQTHMKRLHGEDMKKPRCQICQSEFAGEKLLKQHVAKHDPKIGNGKFQCEVCKIYMPKKHCIQRHKNTIHNIYT